LPSEALSREVDRLDKELRDASKVRETKLRKAGVLERARMASDLLAAEQNVNALRSKLALRTLQLEMRLVFEYLEHELLQIVEERTHFLPWRRGSSAELRLLVAEYALLDTKLAKVAAKVNVDANANANANATGNVDGMAMVVGSHEVMLAELAIDVPDLRSRVGITDGQVTHLTLDTRVRNLVAGVEDSSNKMTEGFAFMGIGVKLLVTDVGTCGRLVWRAILGATLQPREVEALRRTARDLLAFVPFVIILAIPISPLGHVLVFSFIQQSFPALFPSQFTSTRQQSMKRYEELRKQLDQMQEQQGIQWREDQFERAVAAVEALTANQVNPGEQDDDDDDDDDDAGASEEGRDDSEESW